MEPQQAEDWKALESASAKHRGLALSQRQAQSRAGEAELEPRVFQQAELQEIEQPGGGSFGNEHGLATSFFGPT